ncbi:MAG: RpiB/LacA/LacB family sugar-phosphate isomerase [Planctomycetota bacterium]|jgi:ribose 5-phosphate isomerase B|nr:RpiB/LacA/LacB family sugar-phosphate isomerase [Planctomycetota bacterium]
MKIIVASDYSGYLLKEAVRKFLAEAGHEITDVGQTRPEDKISYVDAAAALARQIQAGAFKKGVLFCGTGAGVSLVANKFKGVYCIPCESIFTAVNSACINDANVISLGINVVGPMNACKIVEAWLPLEFCQNFDPDRKAWLVAGLEKFKKIEAENLK